MGLHSVFPVLQHVDADCPEQNDTGYDLLPVGLQADIRKTGFQRRHDENTDQGAYDGADAAGGGSAADDGAADCVKLEATADTR